MTISGNPPFTWPDSTDRGGIKSRGIHPASLMQALENRASLAGVSIANWIRHDAFPIGTSSAGQIPADNDFDPDVHPSQKKWDSYMDQMRTAFEATLVKYNDGGGDPFTKASILTAAMGGGHTDYARSIAEIRADPLGNKEDQEELMTSIDLMTALVDDLIADADSYVSSADPNDNFGNATVLPFGYRAVPVGIGRAFLHFDLAGIAIPVTHAEMRTYGFANPDETSPFDATKVLAPWAEGTITWNNQPGLGAVLDSVLLAMEFTGWISWDVTGAINDVVNNDHGICLKAQTESGLYHMAFVNSRDHVLNKPYLIVTP